MPDRKRDLEVERSGEERARPATPAPPLTVGTLGWASAVGNQAVARAAASSRASIVREEGEPELEEESAEPAVEAAPEAEAEAGEATEAPAEGPAAEELPEELPA